MHTNYQHESKNVASKARSLVSMFAASCAFRHPCQQKQVRRSGVFDLYPCHTSFSFVGKGSDVGTSAPCFIVVTFQILFAFRGGHTHRDTHTDTQTHIHTKTRTHAQSSPPRRGSAGLASEGPVRPTSPSERVAVQMARKTDHDCFDKQVPELAVNLV